MLIVILQLRWKIHETSTIQILWTLSLNRKTTIQRHGNKFIRLKSPEHNSTMFRWICSQMKLQIQKPLFVNIKRRNSQQPLVFFVSWEVKWKWIWSGVTTVPWTFSKQLTCICGNCLPQVHGIVIISNQRMDSELAPALIKAKSAFNTCAIRKTCRSYV